MSDSSLRDMILRKSLRDKKRKRDRFKDIVVGSASAGVAVKATRAGVERVVGAQRFVHGAGSDNINSILRTGLDPKYGASASGGSSAIDNETYRARSRGYVHVAKDNIVGRRIVANPHGALGQAHQDWKKSGQKTKNTGGMFAAYKKGMLVSNPYRNRVGGAMPFESFKGSMEQDPDAQPGAAFKTKEKIGPENLKRSRAGLKQIIKGRSKNLPGYIKNNRDRFTRGVMLTGLGVAAAGQSVRSFKQGIEVKKADMNSNDKLRDLILRKFQESKIQRDANGRFKDIPGKGNDAPKGGPSLRQGGRSSDADLKRTPKGMVQNMWGQKNAQTPGKIRHAAMRLESKADKMGGKGYEAEIKAGTLRDRAKGLRFAADTVDTEEGGSSRTFRQQIPKALGSDKHLANLKRLQSQASAMRDSVIERGMEVPRGRGNMPGKPMIPEGTPISDVKRAYRHATAIALNDAYLIEYKYKLSAEDKAAYKPLEPFIRYTTRRMKSEFTGGPNKGMSDPYKKEFGVPFIDKKTGKQKVNRMTGEARVRPPSPTNNQFIKADIPVVTDAAWLDRLDDAIELSKADFLADQILLKGWVSTPRVKIVSPPKPLAKREPSHIRDLL